MRVFQVLRAANKRDSWEFVRKFIYNQAGFNKYGLKRHDVLMETEDVEEAIRRMPLELQDERAFRLRRAMQLSLNKVYLPKEQWIKYEEDELYMQPYLDEVIREREERENWGKKSIKAWF